MITSTITIAFAIAGLVLVQYAKKLMTKMVTIFLALSSVIYLDPIIGVGQFGVYVFAFASIIASVEPSNSLNLKPYHKAFFVAMGVTIVLVTISEILGFDEMIPKYILGSLYCLVLGLLYLKNPKKLNSRSGILVVWLAQAIKWGVTILSQF